MRSVAVVGSGPSGLFLAKNLFKALKGNIKINIFEKSNAPFGLLKYGVAPDHPEVKVCASRQLWFLNIFGRKSSCLISNHYLKKPVNH